MQAQADKDGRSAAVEYIHMDYENRLKGHCIHTTYAGNILRDTASNFSIKQMTKDCYTLC